ncbi:hypothetical protein BAE44_0015103 [Dichanthelium oligosanthes]|uniref:Uncharacterized protein n=1 Tax=Dichanthelium oligosanthes TaxID=888268 RepID=A0A1E5VFG6_9POAL|nr:hypothetical protein BAE44_0015103 [Dichanthelium oligosanthes]
MPTLAAMASFAIDPCPHAPRGFELILHNPMDPPLRLEAYLGGCMDNYNEDLAITMLVLEVNKAGFELIVAELTDFFIQNHYVRLSKVESPLVIPAKMVDGLSDELIVGPFIGPALALMVPMEEANKEGDNGLMVLDGSLVVQNTTPCKRCSCKMKEPLNIEFPRRRKRLNPDIDGFKSKEAHAVAFDALVVYAGTSYAAWNALAPHISVGNVHGIATGFL